MPKAKRITAERVDDAIKLVLGLRPKEGLRQEEVAKKMAPSIRKAMKRGYPLKEIQEIINKEIGINIQVSKLQKALDENETDAANTQTTPSPDKQPVKQQDASQDTKGATPLPQKDSKPATTGETTEGTGESKDAPSPAKDGNASTLINDEAKDSGVTKDGTDTTENVGDTPICVPFRVDLTTEKSDKDQVKALGARWDYQNFTWYVVPNKDLRPFELWLKYDLAEYQADAANNTTKCASLYAL